MKYLLIAISVLFSLSVNAQRSIRTGKLFLDESIQLNKVHSSDTLLFFMQNNAIGTGLSFSITNPSLSFDFSATDLGFFLNYTNGDTSTFDVRADGVLLQWGVNDGNVGIGTETPPQTVRIAIMALAGQIFASQTGEIGSTQAIKTMLMPYRKYLFI